MTENGIFSKEYIKKQLKLLGVPTDKIVTVHTSMRAVGEVEGRAEGFLQALTEHVTSDGGLLCIPTHTWHRCSGDKITLDVNSDDVCIGTLPKIASVHKAAHRSLNPTHSLAVFGDGEKAERFISRENDISSSSDVRGCMGGLIDDDGYVLLVGVGHDKNTFLHTVEDANGVENRLTDEPYNATVRLSDGEVVTKRLKLIAPKNIGDVSLRYPKLEPAFYLAGAIRYGFIGNARTQLCSARIMYGEFSKIIKNSAGRELFADNTPLLPELYIRG